MIRFKKQTNFVLQKDAVCKAIKLIISSQQQQVCENKSCPAR